MPRHSDVIIVFARAPRLGTVKTRLARDLGAQGALDIYRSLAEHTLRVARAAGPPVHLYYAPADGHDEVRRWLGAGLVYHPQAEGDLGARMAQAFDERFAGGARRVAIVGTDCPALDAATLRAALDGLADVDLVLGPATDGGYYLMALRAPAPSLFADIPWSSARTRAVTLERARAARLTVRLLETRADVDTAQDWAEWTSAATHAPGSLDG